jgi:hypothetical protein
MHSILNRDQNMGLEMELEKLCTLFATQDQKEGMQAFMDKRKSVFTGKLINSSRSMPLLEFYIA